ncbi:putative CwfJ C-terminus 1-domain-containing protein-like protein [Seiridium cardinale]|uniref:CwfJ C-terminus 1-domain-containing protein-like protein n=1 Tax=Seiridium cardinale TaxID=138064 RepID=A0ABR2XXL9_9PEZI
MAAKIIVFGSLNGKLESAFQKLATLHAKNNFSFAIVTGNLFSPDEGEDVITRLLHGDIQVPLTTYFTVGTTPLPAQVIERIERDEDVCENLHYLGKRSVTKTSDGIRIVTLGGALDRSIVGGQSQEQHLPFHTASDATALRGANKADILLTSMWSAGVWSNSRVVLAPESQAAVASSQEIADLCNAIKPRYHLSFSPGDFFWEREPFFYPDAEDSNDRPVTRFISMAPFGNSAKAKAMYAFSLQAGDNSSTLPAGSTLSPFMSSRGTKRQADGHRSDPPKRSRGQHLRQPPPGPGECFFCLANPKLKDHMICSVGEHAYIASAKGPLPNSGYFSSTGVHFPGHQIIIPFAHTPTLRNIPEGEGPPAYKEMSHFREALQAMVGKQSNHQLGAVTWEINRSRNVHTHWQFMPVPIDLLRKGLVEAAFKVEAENLQYPLFEERSLDSIEDGADDFLRLWIWSDDSDAAIQGKELVMSLDDSFRFDLQFPRRVLAKLLQLEARIQWKAVEQTQEEESADAERFKEAFKPWDFTLQ